MADKTPIIEQSTPPSPSPFPKKPHGPMGRPSPALDAALGYTWPSYDVDPFVWEKCAKGLMRGILLRTIKNETTITSLMTQALNMAKDKGWIGDRRLTLRAFGHVCRKYAELKRQHKVIKDHAPVKGFYETGFEPDTAGATKIMEEYEAKKKQREAERADFAAQFPTTAQRKEQEGTTTTPDDQKAIDALNAAVLEPLADAGDELTEPTPAQWGKFWESLRNAAHDLPIEDHREYLHLFYDVASAKDTGKPLNDMLIEIGQHFSKVRAGKETLKIDISKQADLGLQNDSPAMEVPEMTNDAKEAPVASVATGGVPELPEAPFSANFHLWDKHGVDIQFTIRAETVNGGCKKVDATIENRLANGYTVSRPQAQAQAAPMPSNITQMTPAAPAPAPVSVPQSGSDSGTFRIGAIKKVQDEGKTKYELFKTASDEKPALTIRPAGMVKQYLSPHIDVNALTPGTRYNVNWDVDWKDGKINAESGRAFRDVCGVRPVAA